MSGRLSSTEMAQLRHQAQARLERSRLDAEVNSFLQGVLVNLNDRDTEKVSERLDEIEQAMRAEAEEFDRVLFGGSVAKHTYVDGLSDIDALVVLRGDVAGERTPDELRAEFRDILQAHLNMGEVEDIRVGRMAVTVTYRDGTEIQLLPAVDKGGSLMISSATGAQWANIDPKRFTDRLTRLNADQGGAVVPAIKVAKAVIAAQLPEERRPSGYHAEALAIAAFDRYEGPRTPKAMAERFFDAASGDVLQPISDVTGQSGFLDASLGPAGSVQRRGLATRFKQIANTMRKANSVEGWEKLLGA